VLVFSVLVLAAGQVHGSNFEAHAISG